MPVEPKLPQDSRPRTVAELKTIASKQLQPASYGRVSMFFDTANSVLSEELTANLINQARVKWAGGNEVDEDWVKENTPLVNWEPGLTDNAAQIMQGIRQRRVDADFRIGATSRGGALDLGINLTGAILGSMSDPVNLATMGIPVLNAASWTGKAGAAFNKNIWNKILFGSALASAQTGVTEPILYVSNQDLLGEDLYTEEDSLMAGALSPILGGVFGGAGHVIGRTLEMSAVKNAPEGYVRELTKLNLLSKKGGFEEIPLEEILEVRTNLASLIPDMSEVEIRRLSERTGASVQELKQYGKNHRLKKTKVEEAGEPTTRPERQVPFTDVDASAKGDTPVIRKISARKLQENTRRADPASGGEVSVSRTMSSIFSVDVRFFDNEFAKEVGAEGMALVKDGNTLYVKKDHPNIMMRTVGHEFTHKIKWHDPELYRELVSAVAIVDSGAGPRGSKSLRSAFNRAVEDQAEFFENLPKGKQADETIANLVGDAFASERFWRELRKQDRPLFEKIMNFLRFLVGHQGNDLDAPMAKELADVIKKYDPERNTVDPMWYTPTGEFKGRDFEAAILHDWNLYIISKPWFKDFSSRLAVDVDGINKIEEALQDAIWTVSGADLENTKASGTILRDVPWEEIRFKDQGARTNPTRLMHSFVGSDAQRNSRRGGQPIGISENNTTRVREVEERLLKAVLKRRKANDQLKAYQKRSDKKSSVTDTLLRQSKRAVEEEKDLLKERAKIIKEDKPMVSIHRVYQGKRARPDVSERNEGLDAGIQVQRERQNQIRESYEPRLEEVEARIQLAEENDALPRVVEMLEEERYQVWSQMQRDLDAERPMQGHQTGPVGDTVDALFDEVVEDYMSSGIRPDFVKERVEAAWKKIRDEGRALLASSDTGPTSRAHIDEAQANLKKAQTRLNQYRKEHTPKEETLKKLKGAAREAYLRRRTPDPDTLKKLEGDVRKRKQEVAQAEETPVEFGLADLARLQYALSTMLSEKRDMFEGARYIEMTGEDTGPGKLTPIERRSISLDYVNEKLAEYDDVLDFGRVDPDFVGSQLDADTELWMNAFVDQVTDPDQASSANSVVQALDEGRITPGDLRQWYRNKARKNENISQAFADGVLSEVELEDAMNMVRDLDEGANVDFQAAGGRRMERMEEIANYEENRRQASNQLNMESLERSRQAASQMETYDADVELHNLATSIDEELIRHLDGEPSEELNEISDPLLKATVDRIKTRKNVMRDKLNVLQRFVKQGDPIEADEILKVAHKSSRFLQRLTQEEVEELAVTARSARIRARNEGLNALTVLNSEFKQRSDMETLAELNDYLALKESQHSKGSFNKIISMIDGKFKGSATTNRSSHQARRRVATTQISAPIHNMIDHYNLRVVLKRDRKAKEMLVRAIAGEDVKGKTHEGISELGELIRNTYKGQVLELRKMGINTRWLDGFVFSRVHDIGKIDADPEAWNNFMLSAIDWEKTATFKGWETVPDYEGKLEYLNQVREDIRADHARPDPEEVIDSELFQGGLGSSLSKSRQIYFKNEDPSIEFKYDEVFGSGGRIVEGLVLPQITGRQESITTIRDFGHNWKRWVRDVSALHNLDEAQTNRLYKIVEYASGLTDRPVNSSLSGASQITRRVMNLIALNAATLSAMTDVATSLSVLRHSGVNNSTRKFLAAVVRASMRSKDDPERVRLRTMGAGISVLNGTLVRRFGGESGTYGKVKDWNDFMFKWNGMNWWNTVMQESVMDVMTRQVGESLRSGRLDPAMEGALRRHGIDPEEFTKLTSRVEETGDGEFRLDPSAIEDAEIQGRYRGLLDDIMRQGVLEPDLSDEALLRFGLRSGTKGGESVRFIFQYQSFPLAMITKTWYRITRGYGPDHVLNGAQSGFRDSSIEAMVYISTALMIGYMAQAIKDVTNGYNPMTPDDLVKPKNMQRLIRRSGVAGPLENLFDPPSLTEAGGPVVSQAARLAPYVNPTTALFQDRAKGVNTALDSVPLSNFPLVREAKKQLFSAIMADVFNAGFYREYLDNRNQFIAREMGQGRLFQSNDQ